MLPCLGIKIIGGKSSIGTTEFGVFVKKILAGGVAEVDGNYLDQENSLNCLKIKIKFY